ncbi:MAG: helix-turn-helix domain-containing protein [Muribaculaceae bacterium]|nr:helix-turn-helix domain-containing protein [Muribaculaceae bacterium]
MKLLKCLIILTMLAFPCQRGIASSLPDLESHTPVSGGSVYSFCEDNAGFVWAGMLGELVRYDGLRVLKFPIPGSNATSLRPNGIVQLGRDSLLLGGDFGLKVFDTKSLTFGDSIPTGNNPVYTMKRINDGCILIGRAKGLMMMRNGSTAMDTITVPHSVNNLSASVYDIAMSADSTVWITTNYGIFKTRIKDSDRQPALVYVTGSPAGYFSRIAATDSRIYAYSSGMGQFKRGLHVYVPDRNEWQQVDLKSQLPVTALVVSDSLLYMSADNAGITIINTDNNKIAGILNRDSDICRLLSNGVYSLFIDRRGNIYVGYYQLGFQVLSPRHVTTFTPYGDGDSFSTDGMFVRAIARSYPYQITATRDKLMITDERNHTTRTLDLSVFNNCQPVDIVPAGNEFAIGVFGGGVYYIDPKNAAIRHLEESDGLRVCDIDIDQHGRLWVAATEGAYRFVDGKLDKVFNADNSCIKNVVVRIYFDNTGRGWITTQGGMSVFDPKTDKVRNDVFPKGFIDREFVRCITEDVKGNLLFAYDRNKLFISDPELKKFSAVNHHMPIGNTDINIMQQLPDSSWIIGTSEGLYNTSDFNTYIIYSTRDGIVDNHINPSHQLDSVNGRLYLSTGNGLMVADIARLTAQSDAGSLVISEVRYNGERMNGPVPDIVDGKVLLNVPPHTGTIDIFFTDLVSTPDRPDFIEYRIDGDTIWASRPITRPLSLHYTGSLDHSLKVRLSGSPESMLLIETHESGDSKAVVWWTILIAVSAAAVVVYVSMKRRGKKPEANAEPIAADEPAADSQDAASSKYRNLNIPDAELERLSKRLDLLLYDTRIYRQPDLKIGQLADKLGVSTAVLSYYFSQHLGSNYYRFLNSYRIKEFKEMVAQGTYRTYTLSAMSQMCGFSSRTSFFRYFKEAEGISPLDYIKRVEKGADVSAK